MKLVKFGMRNLVGRNRGLPLFISIIFALFSSGMNVAPATASSHASSLKNLGIDEIMFAQGMIPHHQQAIEMSNMAIKNGASAEIKKLAKGIIATQQKEMSQMKYWLTATKSSMMMHHDMGMSGMLSKSDLAALKKLTGNKFNMAFLKAMIAHHEGALEMLDLLDGTKNTEAKKLAGDIRREQSAEITILKKLLTKTK